MYMRKIIMGKMFAGGCVSSFHLTLLARHSVRRRRPLPEGTEVMFGTGPHSTSRQSLTDAMGSNLECGICRPLRCVSRYGQFQQAKHDGNTLCNTIEMVF